MGNTNPLMGGKDYPSSGNIDDPLNWRPKEPRPQVAVAAELIEDPSNLNYRQVPEVGYRVLNVQSNSPASYTGLVSFFDFIVAANKIPLKALDTTFINIIKVTIINKIIYEKYPKNSKDIHKNHFKIYSFNIIIISESILFLTLLSLFYFLGF